MPATDAPSIVIDGRMIYQEQCHGIARVTIELIRNLPRRRDLPVVLVLAEGRTSRFEIDDLAEHVTVRYTRSAISRPYDLRDLTKVVRAENPGVFFSPWNQLAPLRVPAPLVVGIHDCIFESDRRFAGNPARAAAYRANTIRTLRQAAAVVCPSEATAAVLPAFYAGVPETHVVPNGVDAMAWSTSEAERAAARTAFGLPPRYVLTVGARRPHKNQRVLIEALTRLPQDVHLVLLGKRDPRVKDELELLADELGVAGRVLPVQDVTDTELRGIYANASVFAFPSTMEGYGLPPVEAMAAGVPVVASAIPVVAEVCRDAAVLVSPYSPQHWAEAIGSVLQDASLADRLVRSGDAVVAGTSWRTGGERLYAVLRGVALGVPVPAAPAATPPARADAA